MRATPLQRQANQIAEELREVLERVTLEELQSLWENVYDSLQQLDRQRPGIVRKFNVAKALTASQDMWELFKNRLKSRLLEELSDGALTLYGLMSTKYLPGQPLNFSSEQFAKEYEPFVGDRITLALGTIKRRVGRKVVGWYNTPGMTLDQLVTQLQSDFGLNRAVLIAKNEITELHSEVQSRIADAAGITEWWWSTKRDQLVCVRDLVGPDGATYKGCRELHGKVFKIGMPMPPRGSHLGCRCGATLIASSVGKLDKWEESEHPRDRKGEFAPKGEGEDNNTKTREEVDVKPKNSALSFESWSLKTFNHAYPKRGIFEDQYNQYLKNFASKQEEEDKKKSKSKEMKFNHLENETVMYVKSHFKNFKQYNVLGLRTLRGDEKYKIGDRTRNSLDWDFENDTSSDEELDGISTLSLDEYAMDTPEDLLSQINGKVNENGMGYGTGKIILVGGYEFSQGDDPNEKVIKHGVVLAEIKNKKRNIKIK